MTWSRVWPRYAWGIRTAYTCALLGLGAACLRAGHAWTLFGWILLGNGTAFTVITFAYWAALWRLYRRAQKK